VSDAVNALFANLAKLAPFRGDLGYRLIRAAMVFTFYIFGYQKWFSFEAHQIAPFISHSPLVRLARSSLFSAPSPSSRFFPDGWAAEAGGFPAMYLPVAFLVKDFLFLAASFYLLKQDLTRAAQEDGAELSLRAWRRSKTEPA
jgi:uncharacterized membrane protein YkgB